MARTYGMGRVYLRGCTFWVRYHHNGKRFDESSRSDKESDARKLLKQRIGEMAVGRFTGPKTDRVLFKELAELVVSDYQVNGKKSLSVVETRLTKHILPYFGNRRAHPISTADVQSFILHRQQQNASNAEINRELSAIKRAFNLGLRAEKVSRKPYIPKLEERNIRAGFFEPHHFELILAKLPDYLRPPITFAYYTGWRLRSEIFPLTWEQVDLGAETVRLNPHSTKNDEGRVIQLPQVLMAIVADQWRTKPGDCPWVFHRYGKRIRDCYAAWRTAVKEVGLVGRIPHDFRRTSVRNLVRAGVPERVAMAICGHKTRSVFDRYNIVSDGDLKEAARRIDEGVLRATQEPFPSPTDTSLGTITPPQNVPLA